MRNSKNFISIVFLIVFLMAVGSAADLFYPTTVSAGRLPSFDLHFWTDISTQSGSGYIQYPIGLDVNEKNLLAVGNSASPNKIHFFDGLKWTQKNVNFYPFTLEWSKNSRTTALYAADHDTGSIYKSTNPSSENPVWTKIGGTGKREGKFYKPLGMFYGDRDNLYVVDSGNNQIKRWNGLDWGISSSPPDASLLYDIAIYGSITYITDFGKSCIHYMNINGDRVWHKLEDSSFIVNPTNIDIDSEGNLYFISFCKYGSDFKRSIVKYKKGKYSLYVPTGDVIGKISDVGINANIGSIAINEHDNLFYSDHTVPWIVKEQCDIKKIKSLSINGALTNITSGQTVINRSVGPKVNGVNILATPECIYSSISGNGRFALNFGLNVLTVTCTSETGSSNDYTLNITRELSDNALLSEITIDSVPLVGFNPAILTYTGITRPNGTESIVLGASSEDKNAVVTGTGTINLNVGENPILLTVTAQDGITTAHYLVVITREAGEPSETPTPSSSPSPTPAPTPTPAPSPSASSGPQPTESPAPSTEPPENPESTQSPNPSPAESEIANPTDPPAQSSGPSAAPSDKTADKATGNLNWLFITIAAVIAAGAVGYSVYITRKMKKERKES